MKQQTVSEILNTCELGDILTDGKRTWKVTDLDFDGRVLAKPLTWLKGESSFELWSGGQEAVAVIPGLRKALSARKAAELRVEVQDEPSVSTFPQALERIEKYVALNFGNTSLKFTKDPERIIKLLNEMGYRTFPEPKTTEGFYFVDVEW